MLVRRDMPMPNDGIAVRLPDAVLYDSEASLRLVDNALEELHADEPDPVLRVSGLVEALDVAAGGHGQLMASLREELNGITRRLRLEGVTSEQLGDIASLLHRVTEVMASLPHTASPVSGSRRDV